MNILEVRYHVRMEGGLRNLRNGFAGNLPSPETTMLAIVLEEMERSTLAYGGDAKKIGKQGRSVRSYKNTLIDARHTCS